MTLRQAIVAEARLRPTSDRRPPFVVWMGRTVTTADVLDVPATGWITLRFLSSRGASPQGVDMRVEGGWIELANGDHVDVLRTWCDDDLEPEVNYKYHTRSGRLRLYNVYEVVRGDETVVEKMTENAGFWIEPLGPLHKIYHCSPGWSYPADFEALVFEVRVSGSD